MAPPARAIIAGRPLRAEVALPTTDRPDGDVGCGGAGIPARAVSATIPAALQLKPSGGGGGGAASRSAGRRNALVVCHRHQRRPEARLMIGRATDPSSSGMMFSVARQPPVFRSGPSRGAGGGRSPSASRRRADDLDDLRGYLLDGVGRGAARQLVRKRC